ncbi:MAG: hypothetical protein OXG08_06935 [Gammaproteobacteria bacterium]|nr:hypothetical protein [Gammaproteobacteria bacterium]
MEIEAFESYLDRHGSDPDRWPANDEKKHVIQLLNGSERARHILQETQDLHSMLETALHVRDPIGLETRILAAVRSSKENWWTSTIAQWILKPAFVALPLLVGFVIGLAATDSSLVVEHELATAQFDDHSDLLAISNE